MRETQSLSSPGIEKKPLGQMSDEQLRDMFERLTYLRNIEKRKEEVIRLVDAQG